MLKGGLSSLCFASALFLGAFPTAFAATCSGNSVNARNTLVEGGVIKMTGHAADLLSSRWSLPNAPILELSRSAAVAKPFSSSALRSAEESFGKKAGRFVIEESESLILMSRSAKAAKVAGGMLLLVGVAELTYEHFNGPPKPTSEVGASSSTFPSSSRLPFLTQKPAVGAVPSSWISASPCSSSR